MGLHLIDVVSVAGAVGLLGTVVFLTSTARLKPRYALLWLVACVAILAVPLLRYPDPSDPEGVRVRRVLIDDLGELFGVAYKPALLFLAADVVLMTLLLHLSVVVSRLTERTRRLAEELAVVRGEVQERRELEGPARRE
jgi:hypothetical protein